MKSHTIPRSHYDDLRDHLVSFCEAIKLPDAKYMNGLISAHGDKCYGYKSQWKRAGIPFSHGVAIYLLSYVWPYSKEVRETDAGWVKPDQWVIDNYEKFKEALSATFGQ